MNTELSASTDFCIIAAPSALSGGYEDAWALIEGGVYPGWEANSAPIGTEWAVELYNRQEIELQGLVAEDLHWDSETVRIEQAEPARGFFGAFKDPDPAAYGYMREWHIFTTKKLSDDELDAVFRSPTAVAPMMPGMAGSTLNENQLIFGVAREYTSIENTKADGVTFQQDWRLQPTYENIIGNGYPVAQGRIYYTRTVQCWLEGAGYIVTPVPSLPQGIDIPRARVSLMGKTVKPKNFNDHMAVLANNEGIGSW